MRRLVGELVFVVFVAMTIGLGSYPERANAAPGSDGSAAIRLGMSLPLSGPVAAYGKALREGALACFARVNAEGGIHGRKIEVVSLDDGYETERMLANTRRLINEEKVLSLVGFFGSPGTVEAMQALRTAGIPLIGLSTGTSSLHLQPGRYAFSTRASVEKEVAVIIDHAVPLAVTKIGVVYQDDSFGRAGLDGFVEAMKRHRLSAVASVGFDPAKGVTPDIIKQVADAAPQLVLVLATHKPAAAAIRALKKINAAMQFATVSLVGADLLVAELGAAAAKGVIISQVTPYPWNDTVKVTGDYLRAIKALNPEAQPSYYGLEGYIAARITIEALRRSGANPAPDDLVTALEQAPIDLGGYFVAYRPGVRQGSQFVDITILNSQGRILR
ncbi:MAG: ABC transporter permease [Betaproteobacteria bacterium HGW-Betaproteobacteria-12]|nr:MAG: ABC transporter permease [Betaproteobacteria bacterium HGW-Betaproteobacteria-12]